MDEYMGWHVEWDVARHQPGGAVIGTWFAGMVWVVSACVWLAASGAGVAQQAEGFEWSWDREDAGRASGDAAPRLVEATEYRRLLQQNMELRKRLDTLTRNEDTTRTENDRLTLEIKALETKLGESVALAEQLRKSGAGDLELQKQLDQAEADKKKLLGDLASLNQRLTEVNKQLQERQSSLNEPQIPALGQIEMGAELFKTLEGENDLLRQKLVELESTRKAAVKEQEAIVAQTDEARARAAEALAEQERLERELGLAREEEAECRRTIDRLMEKLPGLEKELASLGRRIEEKNEELQRKEKELEMLTMELQRREHRLIKAERTATILENAHKEVAKARDREQRDVHFNMAAIYTRDGKVRDAEQQYLRALQIDPNDADAHYNLGILYDEELNDPERAAMHYRKYIQLNPNAADVDIVKGWLMNLELNR